MNIIMNNKYSLLIIYIISVLLVSCGGGKAKPDNVDRPVSMADINKVTDIYALGQIAPMDEIVDLSSEVYGIVSRVYVHDGDSVKNGDVILELKHDVETTEANSTKAKIETQQIQVRIAQIQYQKQMQIVENNKKLLNRIKALYSSKAETGQKLDDTETDYNNSELELKRLDEEVDNAKATLTQFQTELANQEAIINQYIIRAPNTGKLLKLNVLEGGSVTPGASIGQFAPNGPTIAICEVDELFSSLVKTGQSVVIKKMGAEDEFTTGKVYFISPYLRSKSLFSNKAGEQEDRRVREIRIKLDNSSEVLYNMRVDCFIKVK